MSRTYETFDPNEMRLYGFDPDSEKDRLEWADTTPPGGTPTHIDYERDAFEFGAPPNPTHPDEPETTT